MTPDILKAKRIMKITMPHLDVHESRSSNKLFKDSFIQNTIRLINIYYPIREKPLCCWWSYYTVYTLVRL